MIGAELRPRTPPEAQPLAVAARPSPPAAPATPIAIPQGANNAASPAPPTTQPKPNNGFGPFPKQ
jgi:hypothetical protein